MNATKTVLVTGAARRIGYTITEKLHQNGFNVIIHYQHSEQAAKKLAARLNELRPNSAVTFSADLTNLQQMQALVDFAVSQWGRIDVLVNNAALFIKNNLHDLSNWQILFDCNVRAPYFLSVQLQKNLAEHQGCIVNIADIHGLKPLKNYSIYSMTKAAVVMLTHALAKELAPSIRVNAIAPGPTVDPDGENSLTPERKQELISFTLTKQLGSPETVADAVQFCIGNPHLNGEIIRIDGGRLINQP